MGQRCRFDLYAGYVMWVMRYTILPCGNLLFENMLIVAGWLSGFGDEVHESEYVSSGLKRLGPIDLLMLEALFQLFKSSDFTRRIRCGRDLWDGQGVTPDSHWSSRVYNKSVVALIDNSLRTQGVKHLRMCVYAYVYVWGYLFSSLDIFWFGVRIYWSYGFKYPICLLLS